MDYILTCVGATTPPDITTVTNFATLATSCTSVGGAWDWISNLSSSSFIPSLSIADGEALAGAILLVWVTAWGARQVYNLIHAKPRN